MSKQKLVVFIVAIIGMIATFLPWYEFGRSVLIVGHQSTGWWTFVLFAVAFVLGLRGKQKDDMTNGLAYLASALSLIAAFIVLWQVINIGLDKEGARMTVLGNMMAEQTRVMYGAYQVIIAGVCLPFGAFLFRDRRVTR